MIVPILISFLFFFIVLLGKAEHKCPNCGWYDYGYFQKKLCPNCGKSYSSVTQQEVKKP
jgi:hypothetical protein